jgi:hypothetical protein
MNLPHPRRRAARFARARRTPSRLLEGLPVNSPFHEADVRQELVARVRQEIQAGTYDTPDKLEAALARLADRLAAD